MGLNEWGGLFILAAIWGSSFIFIEVALAGFSPYLLVFLRIFIGALTLTAILALRGVTLPKGWHLWRLFFIMGLMQNAIPFCLITWGQQHITAGLTSIFNATIPFFSVVLAHLFTQEEKVSPVKAIGLLTGIFGIVTLIGFDSLTQLDLKNLGQFAVLGAAICYAVSIVWGLKFSGLKPGVAAAGMLWCASLSMLPVLLLNSEPNIRNVSWMSLFAIIALGVFCTAIAYIIFFQILEKAGATATSLVAFLIPISALILANLFLGEQLSGSDIPGIALVFIGLILIDGRILKFLNQEKLGNSG
ncbi:MAG: DMT family transporter [Methyloligellaceae bacterium]